MHATKLSQSFDGMCTVLIGKWLIAASSTAFARCGASIHQSFGECIPSTIFAHWRHHLHSVLCPFVPRYYDHLFQFCHSQKYRCCKTRMAGCHLQFIHSHHITQADLWGHFSNDKCSHLSPNRKVPDVPLSWSTGNRWTAGPSRDRHRSCPFKMDTPFNITPGKGATRKS